MNEVGTDGFVPKLQLPKIEDFELKSILCLLAKNTTRHRFILITDTLPVSAR